MPADSVVLSVQLQHGTIYLWALVDPQATLVERYFTLRMTGELFDETNQLYIGTAQDGAYVIHAFETFQANPQPATRTAQQNADIRNT